MKKAAWFAEWFDSPYYHVLYKHRDFEEAEHFIDNLIDFLNPAPDAKALDLACGNGRHALYLCKKGLDVYGTDLSERNIEQAKKLVCHNLHFDVHDMRKAYRENFFDYVFNFFTSFGYFDDEKDNQATINAIAAALKEDAVCVIDFMNVQKVVMNLKGEEVVEREGIEFHMTRRFEQGFIIKTIRFTTMEGEEHEYEERVQALKYNDFKRYFRNSGLQLKHCFGNYQLDEFDEQSSDRVIMVAQKTTEEDPGRHA